MCAGAHRTEHRGIENEGDAMSEAKRSAGRLPTPPPELPMDTVFTGF